MNTPRKAVYFFCTGPAYDPVAGTVYRKLPEIYDLNKTDIVIDDNPVLSYTDSSGNVFYFVSTRKVVCHDYNNYLPIMNRFFSECDFAGLVTWHEGQNAPDRVLSVHTTGDAESGYFAPADPVYMRNLMLGLERNRMEMGLEDFRVTTEATHWSGVVYDGGTPDMIPLFPVPIYDIEIGSTPESWSEEKAAITIAKALGEVFNGDGRKLKNLLCAGGIHFEPSFANAVLHSWGDNAFGITHILANQWLITGQYDGSLGQNKLEACVASIKGGIQGITFHDNLKGAYKEQLRVLGRKLGVPVFKHQLLRRPEDIAWETEK